MAVVVADQCEPADETRFLCVITDETDTNWRAAKTSVNLPASTSVSGLYESIAKSTCYEPGTFLLAWLQQQDQSQEEVLLGDDSRKTLLQLGLTEKRNRFVLKQKDGRDPVRIDGADSTCSGWTSSATTDYYSASQQSVNSSTASSTGFIGLVNQAMTCYLNSLLQTLYMTPEFRNALYNWRFTAGPDEEERSIPYQLQKLFVNLQTSKSRAIETTDVTKSFGWDSEEAWQQHDVQELCRVMFDALEKTFTDTDQENLIKQLYEGQMQDYVKCLECGRTSARYDTYLDIPLVIKPFGSDKVFRSVEEALQEFVTPETLDGNNQYFCEQCGKKCNAHKGLRFTSFPYLLTLQLKRFDFDYMTFNRIKLNDRMTFPLELDLNSFIEKERDNEDREATSSDELHGSCTKTTAERVLTTGSAATPSGLDGTGDCDGGKRGDEAAGGETSKGASGRYVYQLFSIMVHSGSAIGGHYYAYIRSFDDGKWYSFNDMSVLPISEDDIKKTYGSVQSTSSTYYSNMYTSSANAYMLMYRQVNVRNALPLSINELPDHLKRVVDAIREQEEASRRQAEIDRAMCKIKLYFDDPKEGRVGRQFAVQKDVTLKDAVSLAHQLCGLDGVVPVEQCRLVKYDHSYELLERSYDDQEEVPMGQLLGGVRHTYMYDLLLETRSKDETFMPYKPNGCMVKVLEVDLANKTVKEPKAVRAQLGWSVAQLKNMLQQKFGFPVSTTRVLMEKYWGEPLLLSNSASILKKLGFYRSNRVFVETTGEPGMEHKDSQLRSVLDLYAHTIGLSIALPAASIQESDNCQADGPDSAGHLSSDKKRMLSLRVDKRMTVAEFKDQLQEEINISSSQFKLFRVSSYGQEFEIVHLTDTLSDSQLITGSIVRVQLGRALAVDECRAKVFLFKLNSDEMLQQLPDVIHPINITVSKLKVHIVNELNAISANGIQLDPYRVRLRKKSWKGPGKVLRDDRPFDDSSYSIISKHSWDAVLEEIDSEDPIQLCPDRHIVYARHWQPSSYTLGPFQELVLDDKLVETFKAKVSILSGIPVERLDFTKAKGSFPSEMSLLEIQDDMKWNPNVIELGEYPLYLPEDEGVFFYRDSAEEVLILSDEKRLELQKQDLARATRHTRVTFGPALREKALKIYTEKDRPDGNQ